MIDRDEAWQRLTAVLMIQGGDHGEASVKSAKSVD
jgi:hypothetical protein